MSRSEGTRPRFRRWWIGPTLAVLITAGVPVGAGIGNSGSRGWAAAADDPTVTATKQALDRFIKLWNEEKLEELVAVHYTDDSLMLPPNHEPIRGRAGILEYLKGARDALGEFDPGDYTVKMTASGNGLVSFVGQFNFYSGKLRFTTHELYQRQPDGSVRNMVDMFGFRDPLK
jgi:ketosteroid isomerase-like protein